MKILKMQYWITKLDILYNTVFRSGSMPWNSNFQVFRTRIYCVKCYQSTIYKVHDIIFDATNFSHIFTTKYVNTKSMTTFSQLCNGTEFTLDDNLSLREAKV